MISPHPFLLTRGAHWLAAPAIQRINARLARGINAGSPSSNTTLATGSLAQQAASTEARVETLETQVETLETQSSQAKAFLEGLRDLMGTLFPEGGS